MKKLLLTLVVFASLAFSTSIETAPDNQYCEGVGWQILENADGTFTKYTYDPISGDTSIDTLMGWQADEWCGFLCD